MAANSLIRGLREQIVNQLRDDILSGRLEAGARLSETKLADRFGVSRGPIREALVQLTNEGLLIGRPNCGVSVAETACDAIRELIVPIRRTIETYALRQFFDDITAEDYLIWDEILSKMEEACGRQDYHTTAELDIAFHRSLLVPARGQPDLLAIWQTIVARIRTHFHQTHRNYGDPLDIYREHQGIVDAFRGGNKEAAIRILEVNIT